jgi:hypothetical protein
MIKNEAEIRVAVLAILVGVLALNGFGGCSVVVLLVLLPWRPFLVVGGYLAQPVVDWRIRKARERQEKGLGQFVQIEQELDTFLGGGKREFATPEPSATAEVDIAAKPSRKTIPQPAESVVPPPVEVFRPVNPNESTFQKLPVATPSISAALAVSSVIEDHVRKFPHGAFSNMNLEVERVNFSGETAEAYVKFKSPHVKELAISQRYTLRKSGAQWEVESRQPANGSSKVPHYAIPGLKPPNGAHVGMA